MAVPTEGPYPEPAILLFVATAAWLAHAAVLRCPFVHFPKVYLPARAGVA